MPAEVDVGKLCAQFDNLLASDFSESWDTPTSLITLAGYLNPAVSAFIDDDYDQVLDEAFSSGTVAVPKSQLGKLFAQALVA